jgi:hypothetical protein
MKLTKAERSLIQEMCVIADAGIPGEGDYQGWTRAHYKRADAIAVKMNEPDEKPAATLGRLGGSVSSEAKSAAVRANGKLGGRPLKALTDCGRPKGSPYEGQD